MKTKWKLLGLMLFSIVALTYCTQEYLSDYARETPEVMFNFSASLPDAASHTRVANITRYIVEIYKTADQSTLIKRVEQANSSIVVYLENNTNYTCLFWADEVASGDNTNGTFNALDLKNVTLNAGKTMTEAFFARLDITTTTTNFDIILDRATAKVNMVATAPVAANKNLQVTYNEYKSFNTFASEVTGTAVATSKTFNSAATEDILGTFITFASVTGILSDFTTIYNTVATNEMKNTALKANYITNIRGDFTAGAQDFTVIVITDDSWTVVIEGIHINVGTVGSPTWIIVADRNAKKGGNNGATFGKTMNDFGYYYTSSSATTDPTNADKAYRACFDFGIGKGFWRLPTRTEWTLIVGNSGNSHSVNANRKLKWANPSWKLYDERVNYTSDFVVLPMSGYLGGASGPYSSTYLTERGYYFTGTIDASGSWFSVFKNDGTSNMGADPGTDGCSVRCVRDI